jgi:lipopolysaccharide/colanic/teichoic acid biosynthesis glycosyltransferase
MNNIIKRILDLLMSVSLLVLLSPLFLLIALAIKLDSTGPALFLQKRRGKHFRLFTLMKFRSLRHNAPDPHGRYEMLEDDSRITRVGRFLRRSSLDELPQLFNVIVGTMSLVGPRPLVEWESQSSLLRWAERYHVKPGITGSAQLSGRNAIDFDSRCALDVEYVRKHSNFLDLRLILKTPFMFLKSEGNYPTASSRNTLAGE